jgi:hypothetical protein
VGLAARFADEELVLGRAARVLARVDDELARGAQQPLALAQGVLVQRGDRKVPVDGRRAG